MLPGVSGTLIAPTFLERVVREEFAESRDSTQGLRPLERWWRRVDRTLGPAASVRAIVDIAAIPFFEARGYQILSLEPLGAGFSGAIRRQGGSHVAVRITSWTGDLDREWREAVRAGRVTGARWGIVFSGRLLRVVDATRSWSRRALEFDLPSALSDERSAAALMTIVEAAGAAPDDALAALVGRSDRHGVEVCESLSDGVLDALSALFSHLRNAQRRSDAGGRDAFEQAVTVVYRLLFLLFAEARAVVPTWHHTYQHAYTVDALCARALAQPQRRGLWKGVQAISRLAHQGCRAGDLVVTAFNGRLFSPRHTPLAERASVSDEAVGRAVISLATTKSRGSRERIAYGDLGVEQLGAVYERVLEYEPAPPGSGGSLARTSHDRKSSGSFYTPRSVTDFLVRRALHPLVAGKSSEEILSLRVVDPAMGSGAFLVAACRFLGDAAERALVREGALPSSPAPEERSAVLRQVAQRCLFGVDLNPMAVQLARLSLWLSTLSADRPLTFLDHHLATGDSLIGASLLELAREPFSARSQDAGASLPLFALDAGRELSDRVLPERFRIGIEPGDTASAVRAKERVLAELGAAGTPLARWKEASNLWCAAWFWNDANGGAPGLTRGVYHDVLGALTGRRGLLASRQYAAVTSHANAVARARRFFHWELEFPEAFFTSAGARDPRGGFDAVIGNPPWEMLRADLGDEAARGHMRTSHRASLRFFREARVYRHQSSGHTNRYQLFVERAMQLARPGGRIALIVPSGLASDQGSARLRRALFDHTRIERVFGFDNRHAIFPIHRAVRFLLLTANTGDGTDRLVCSLGHSDTRWLDQLPDAAAEDSREARAVFITRAALETWDPEHVTVPWLTRPEDLDILSAVCASISPLAHPDGWHVTFGRELNATDDRSHFSHRPPRHDATLLPVIEGKHLEPFRALPSASARVIAAHRAATLLDASRTFGRARLAYRDVASATNRLTLIAARLAPGLVSTHTVFCSKDRLGEEAQFCLLALLNSLTANFLVRLRVTTHVTASMMARLPVPRPPSKSCEFQELASLARGLEKTGIAGHEPAYARLNALAARLYGLTHAQYGHVLSTFPLLSRHLRSLAAAAYGQATETQRTER